MAFFNDLGKKLSQAGQATVQKTKELADVAKLNSMISDEEKRINNAYTEIGKLYVELHESDNEEAFTALIESIRQANEKIADLKNQAAEIKGIVKCDKCGAEVAKGSAFCGACGNPIPVLSVNAEMGEVPETTAATEEPAADAASVTEPTSVSED